MSPVTILLVDDHVVVREGIRSLLRGVPGFKVVGTASSGREAVLTAIKLSPQIILMDVAMPLMNGIQAASIILKALDNTKVLMLSAYSDAEYVERAIEAGASGYLLKQTTVEAVVTAIRKVVSGERYFSSPAVRRAYENYHRKDRTGPLPCNRLTARETELLQLIAEGYSSKVMASDLGLSIKTVEKHRQSVMDKLGIHDIAGLTRLAIATGIVENRCQHAHCNGRHNGNGNGNGNGRSAVALRSVGALG